MSLAACPFCGCGAPAPAHDVVAPLIAADVDAAIDAGLLGQPSCAECSPTCRAMYDAAQAQRVSALAARARFRAREARLARRAAEREAARAARTQPGVATAAASLPPAAAAALQRALARARSPR